MIILLNSMIWIMGGYNEHGKLNSTEFVSTKDGAVNGPTLPEGVMSHCSVILNENIYLIGGSNIINHEDTESRHVWVANPSNGFNFTEGPPLITPRMSHGCSTMSKDDKSIIIVAGGMTNLGHGSKSVEILDPSSNKWVKGT